MAILIKSVIKYLEQGQVTKLLETIKKHATTPRDYPLWVVAYWRGLRASEVGKLTLDDWHPDSGRLYVHRLKGSLSGEYKVSPEEVQALRSWIKTRGTKPGPLFPANGWKPLSRQHLHNRMVRYSELAGIPRPLAHFHVLRHSIAVHLVDQGVDLLHIKDWLGHRSIESTMVYAALRNPTRDKVAQQVYGAA